MCQGSWPAVLSCLRFLNAVKLFGGVGCREGASATRKTAQSRTVLPGLCPVVLSAGRSPLLSAEGLPGAL